MDGLLNTFFFVIFILVIGCISIEIKKIIDIPYTPIVMLFGIIFGYFKSYIFLFEWGIQNLLNINPHGILFIFVPGLVFDTAFNHDHFIFKKQFWQIIILAGPGVILGCIINSLIFQFILGYSNEISFISALTFSSIFCSTDTVAVLSLLKELGISKKFSSLIKGENLLNDGTAMSFYLFFSNILKGKVQSSLLTIYSFLKLSIGGPLFGILISFIFIIWIQKVNSDYFLLTLITLISCYITFFYSEIILNVSGILSIVSLGIFMGYISKTEIKLKVREKMDNIWGFIQLFLEILLFFMTGWFVGNTLYCFEKLTITYTDVLKVFFFYLLLIFSRFIMIVIFLPLLNKTGPKINMKEIIVLTYSGLRGGIALSFGLIIYIDTDYNIRFRELVLYYMSGIVALTLLINGSTIKYLLKKINFEPKTISKWKIENNINKELIIDIFKKISILIHNDYKMVRIKTIFKTLKINKKIKKIDDINNKLQKDISFKLFEEARMRIYHNMKINLNIFYENNIIAKNIYYEIEEIINYSIYESNETLNLWNSSISKLIQFNKIKLYIEYIKLPFIGRFIENFMVNNVSKSYFIVLGIIKIINEIILNSYSLPISNRLIYKILNELKLENQKFQKYLNNIIDSFPELLRVIQTKESAQILINEQKKILKKMLLNGNINENIYKIECLTLNNNINKIKYSKINWNTMNINILNLVFENFKSLDFDSKQLVRDNIKEVYFKENEYLLKLNTYISGIFIITKGYVEEEIKEYKEILSFGTLINYSNIIKKDHKSISNVIALTKVSALFLDLNAILDLMKINKNFENNIYKSSIINYLKYYDFKYYLNNIYALQEKINSSNLIRGKTNDLVDIENGGILIEGKIKKVDKEEFLKGFIVIDPFSSYFFQIIEDSIILKFINETDKNSYSKESFRIKEKSMSVYNCVKEDSLVEKNYRNYRKNILIT